MVDSTSRTELQEGAQETMEALGGLDIMPTHLDVCRCRHV